MKGLDDYIMGIHQHGEEDVPHECPKCGAVKDVPMSFDMGGWFYKDDEAWCKKCECEMEIIEEASNE